MANSTWNFSVAWLSRYFWIAAACFETLEEINIRYRETFLAGGGENFTYIPALNDRPAHINALTHIILNHI